MEESASKVNTSLEAYKLVKDPIKLFSLLYSKYGDIQDDFYSSFTNQLIFKSSTIFAIKYREVLYNNYFLEYLRRYYRKREVKERVPNLYDYYKNYHLFYLKPTLRNFHLESLLHKYQDKKAEIFYRNNYDISSAEKMKSEDNYVTSSLSSSDHYTNNKTIFSSKVKLLLEGNNLKDSLNVSNINNVDKLKDNLSIVTNEENTLNDIISELKNEKDKTKIKTHRVTRKNNSPNTHSKSPNFQIKSIFHIQSSNNNNINQKYNYNILNQKRFISQKNSNSKKKIFHQKNFFSPKLSSFFNHISENFGIILKNRNNFLENKNKKNKTGNNSNNNTIIKQKGNINNICNIKMNNFQSNFKNFSKLSTTLKNNQFNLTFFSQINSINNSKNNMSINKSGGISKNRKIINEMNLSIKKEKSIKKRENKTFEVKIKISELKKNYTNSNLLRFKSTHKSHNKNQYNNKLDEKRFKTNKCSVNKSKKIINRKSQTNIKKKKSFVSICSNSSPKFSYVVCKKDKNLNNVKENNPNNFQNNLDNNTINNNQLKNNNIKKSNISYTNNNFNINFNNVYFCSSRTNSLHRQNNNMENKAINPNTKINNQVNNNIITNSNINFNNKKSKPIILHKSNIINYKNNIINKNATQNIGNLYVKSLNNLYNFSRNKNYKISNSLNTQVQSQSIIKSSKIIKISDSKINSFIVNNNSVNEDKNIKTIQKKYKKSKILNEIEDLIMKSQKTKKNESHNKIFNIINNKSIFNNCNKKNKNQTISRVNYNGMFIKNLKKTSFNSVKVAQGKLNNNENVYSKK